MVCTNPQLLTLAFVWRAMSNSAAFASIFLFLPSRENPPVPEGPFFTRDVYDKYTLAPNIRELSAFLRRYVNWLT